MPEAVKKTLKSTRAVVTLVVEYDEMPSDEHLEELVACARGEGAVQTAELAVLAPFKRDLRSL